MAKNNVIIPEVIEEIPLEKIIDNTLVKHNVTEAVIASLKEKYKDLKLSNINDKEGYLEIKDAKKEVRKYGILTEKLCKAGREDAIKVQKLWLGKEKEILGKIAEVEAPLEAEIKRFDDEEQRVEDERLKRQEEAYMQRQTELLKFGAVYANGCFNLNDVIYEADLIKEADEDVYQNSILVKYKIQYEKMNADKVEEERIKAEREAELTRQREEFEKQQAIFKRQQEEFQKQQSEAQKIKNDEEEKRIQEYKAKMDEQNKRRVNQVMALGMSYKFDDKAFSVHDVFVAQLEISMFTDTEWDGLINKITPVINERKEAAEKLRLERIESEKQQAIELAAKQERERIAEEQRQTEIKRQQEEARKAEELAQASDTVKYADLLKQINAIVLPEMRSGQYRKKVSIIREKLDEIKLL